MKRNKETATGDFIGTHMSHSLTIALTIAPI